MDDSIFFLVSNASMKKIWGSVWIKYLRIFFSSRHCVETDYLLSMFTGNNNFRNSKRILFFIRIFRNVI